MKISAGGGEFLAFVFFTTARRRLDQSADLGEEPPGAAGAGWVLFGEAEQATVGPPVAGRWLWNRSDGEAEMGRRQGPIGAVVVFPHGLGCPWQAWRGPSVCILRSRLRDSAFCGQYKCEV